MLVLTRKKNQSIVIGNNIEIRILKMGKNSVEIGISAPKSYSIFRKEVFEEIQAKNVQAIKSAEMGDLANITNVRNILEQLNLGKEMSLTLPLNNDNQDNKNASPKAESTPGSDKEEKAPKGTKKKKKA